MRLNKQFCQILKESGVDRHYNQNSNFILSFLDFNIIEEAKKDKRKYKFVEYHNKVKDYLKKHKITITKKEQLFDIKDKKSSDKKLKLFDVKLTCEKKGNKGLYTSDNLEELTYYLFECDNKVFLNLNIKCLTFFDPIIRKYGKSDMIELNELEIWNRYLKKTRDKYIEYTIKDWYVGKYQEIKKDLF